MKTITYIVSDEKAEEMRKGLLAEIHYGIGYDLKKLEAAQLSNQMRLDRASAELRDHRAKMDELTAMYESAFGPVPVEPAPKEVD